MRCVTWRPRLRMASLLCITLWDTEDMELENYWCRYGIIKCEFITSNAIRLRPWKSVNRPGCITQCLVRSITAYQRSCGKVMFSVMFVGLFRGGYPMLLLPIMPLVSFRSRGIPLPSPYKNSPPGLSENRRGDIRLKCLLVVNGFQCL